MHFASVEDLAGAIDRWCDDNHVAPANGQASSRTTTRTVRYYRTLGLVDGPEGGTRGRYGEKHFLQLAGIRLLQAQGLPLRRIQLLLMGRSLDDLRRVRQEGLREIGRGAPPALPPLVQAESWRVCPVDEAWFLVSRRGQPLAPEHVHAIREILAGAAPAVRGLPDSR